MCFSLLSPPGSPTTVGFFPSPSSLSTPGGLVRMPGLTYNSAGVKDLINAVQGYQVRGVNAELVIDTVLQLILHKHNTMPSESSHTPL